MLNAKNTLLKEKKTFFYYMFISFFFSFLDKFSVHIFVQYNIYSFSTVKTNENKLPEVLYVGGGPGTLMDCGTEEVDSLFEK